MENCLKDTTTFSWPKRTIIVCWAGVLCALGLGNCVLFDPGPYEPTPNSVGDVTIEGDTPTDSPTDPSTDASEEEPKPDATDTDIPVDIPPDQPVDIVDPPLDSLDAGDATDPDPEPLDTSDAGDGGEEDSPVCITIWVDVDNDTGTEDGTEEHAYTTITSALTVAHDCDTIQIQPGTYTESLDITTNHLTLRGMGATSAATTIENAGDSPTVSMVGDSIVIENLSIVGGTRGVSLSNCDSCQLSGLDISDVTGDSGPSTDVDWESGEVGGLAAAVTVENSTAFVLVNNTISSVTGGTGGGGRWGGTGGSGGLAVGVFLSTASGTLENNTLSDINGGAGGVGGDGGSGGTGGIGAGIRLTANSTDNVFVDNEILSISGGNGGAGGGLGSNGANQSSFGVTFDETSLDNQINQSNTVGGNAIVFIYDQHDLVLEGTTLSMSTNPTNYGVIVMIDSTNITIRNWEISGFTGVSGTTGHSTTSGESGGDGFGIYVSGSTCTLEANVISGITGGQGGTGGFQYCGATETGGAGHGIYVTESVCTIQRNNVYEIQGGLGGTGGYEGDGGAGGTGVGIHLVGAAGDIDGNVVSNIEAGLGGALGYNGSDGDEGTAVGVWLESGVTSHQIVNNTFYSIEGQATTAAIYLDTGSHLANVVNTIFSLVEGPCLFNSGANSSSQLAYEYNLFHSCGGGEALNSTNDGDNLTGDPAFEAAIVGNFHLHCDGSSCSPAVDTGDPSSNCSAELPLNGCRINMGAFGNTSDAARKTVASDCRPACP